MVELARLQRIQALRADGWDIDDECAQLQRADDRIVGPTFMKDPAGVVHAVTALAAEPLRGAFHRKLYRLYDGGRCVAQEPL